MNKTEAARRAAMFLEASEGAPLMDEVSQTMALQGIGWALLAVALPSEEPEAVPAPAPDENSGRSDAEPRARCDFLLSVAPASSSAKSCTCLLLAPHGGVHVCDHTVKRLRDQFLPTVPEEGRIYMVPSDHTIIEALQAAGDKNSNDWEVVAIARQIATQRFLATTEFDDGNGMTVSEPPVAMAEQPPLWVDDSWEPPEMTAAREPRMSEGSNVCD